jgi:membrane glycosyltransferase
MALKRVGLLVTPEESAPPPIATRANALAQAMAAKGHDDADGLRSLHDDPEFCALHEAFLPPSPPRAPGDITPERAMAEAKLNDARSIDDAAKWLHRKERMTLLHDRALIGLLMRLPAPAAKEKAVA